MFRIGKSFTFESAHQIPGLPEGHKCGGRHGHSYTVTVTLEREELVEPGFVTDFGDLAPFKRYINECLDHRDLNQVLEIAPTSELLAWHLAECFIEHLEPQVPGRLATVRISETATSWAEYERPLNDDNIAHRAAATNRRAVWDIRTDGAREGPSTGQLALFIRLSHCNLSCPGCDTPESWDWSRHDPRTESRWARIDELLRWVHEHKSAELVVITGGSRTRRRRGTVQYLAQVDGVWLQHAARTAGRTGGISHVRYVRQGCVQVRRLQRR